VIRTQGLTKTYRGVHAVDGIDLDVREGDVYGFLGANGSGKTTTVRMLLGLVLASSGQAELFGEQMPRAAASVLPRVGSLVEGPGAYPHLSGRANLALFDAASGSNVGRSRRRARIDEVLEQVGLAPGDKRPVKTYSLGMRQRLGLAAALMRRPPLLVLDEPTNGLDPQGIREMRRLLLELNRQGTTIFLSSHLLAEIEQMCTHAAVMSAGRLVAQGTLEGLRQVGRPRMLLTTPDPQRAIEVLERLGIQGATIATTHDGATVTALLADASGHLDPPLDAIVAALVNGGVRVRGFQVQRPSLEDRFVALTGEGFDVVQ
jgi:ABC-2 type transport system ATP-binding protein